MPTDNRICANCVSDTFLKKEISGSPIDDQACDYCSATAPTIDLGDLALRFDAVIESFYEVSSLTDAVVLYGHNADGEPLHEVLEKYISPVIVEDLVESLTSYWFDRSSMEARYGEDPWFVQNSSQPWQLSAEWEKMGRSLLREARFVNPIAAKTLESIFGNLLNDRTSDGSSVIVEVGPGCRLDTFYRARVFQTIRALEREMSHPERALGPPPPGVGAAGRMNAKGVSVFYGATHPEIAIAEVRPPVGCHVAITAFKVIRHLRLLDLTQLSTIELDKDLSVFDPATVEIAMRCSFLNQLEQKLIMPVMPELVDEGYLTTQAIADYLATHPALMLDGIIFRSVQLADTPDAPQGQNVILFTKASKVLHSDEGAGGNARFDLWENEEGAIRVAPHLWIDTLPISQSASNRMLGDEDIIAPALLLDRESLEIHIVRGVQYHSKPPSRVRIHNPRSSPKPPKF